MKYLLTLYRSEYIIKNRFVRVSLRAKCPRMVHSGLEQLTGGGHGVGGMEAQVHAAEHHMKLKI